MQGPALDRNSDKVRFCVYHGCH